MQILAEFAKKNITQITWEQIGEALDFETNCKKHSK